MRPRELTMRGFRSYRDEVRIDFRERRCAERRDQQPFQVADRIDQRRRVLVGQSADQPLVGHFDFQPGLAVFQLHAHRRIPDRRLETRD